MPAKKNKQKKQVVKKAVKTVQKVMRRKPNKTVGGRVGNFSAPTSFGSKIAGYKPKITRASYDRMQLSHCELFCEISSTTSYSPSVYTIGITSDLVFPWGHTQSLLYENYIFKKLRFIYEPLCGTAALGSFDMAMIYDPNAATPADVFALNSNEDKHSSSMWLPGSFSCTSQNLHKMKELWCNDGYNEDSLRTAWVGRLMISAVSSTVFLAGRVYVDYTVEFFTPRVSPKSVSSATIGGAFLNPEGFIAVSRDTTSLSVTIPDSANVVLDKTIIGDITVAPEPSGNVYKQNALKIITPQDLVLDSTIGLVGQGLTVFKDYDGWLLATTFAILNNIGTVLAVLPAAVSKFVDGYNSIVSGVSIVASVFVGVGPWYVTQDTEVTGLDATALLDNPVYYDAVFLELQGTPPGSLVSVIALRTLIDNYNEGKRLGGFQNGNNRLTIAGVPVSSSNMIGADPNIESSGGGVVSHSVTNDLVLNYPIGPYLIFTNIVGTGITAFSLFVNNVNDGILSTFINTTATAAFYCMEAYFTGVGNQEFQFSSTATTITTFFVRVCPSAEYLYLSPIKDNDVFEFMRAKYSWQIARDKRAMSINSLRSSGYDIVTAASSVDSRCP